MGLTGQFDDASRLGAAALEQGKQDERITLEDDQRTRECGAAGARQDLRRARATSATGTCFSTCKYYVQITSASTKPLRLLF